MANRSHSKQSLFDQSVSRLIAVTGFVVLLLALCVQPVNAAKSLNDAVRKAEKSASGKVISARTVEKNNRRTHEVRVLTDKGKVKTMRYPARSPNQNKAKKNRKKNKDK